MALREYLAGEIAQDCTDGLLTRRESLRRLGLLGFSLASASGLLAACGDDGDDEAGDGAAASTSTTARSAPSTAVAAEGGATIAFAGPQAELTATYASPADPRAGVLVIHENRGLTPHFHDLVRRFADEGYAALSVDLLSPEGGTESLADPAAAPAALAAAPLDRLLADLSAGLDELERRAPGRPSGTVGFCFGGGMVWSLLAAGEDRLAAAVPFYGPAPEPADFSGAEAAVLAVYAELDSRVNASRDRAEAALEAAGLTYEIRTFPGVDHAFFNDTGPRYDEAAAGEANQAMLAWFAQHLA